ncbi:MAG TPA: hypothetical protein P5287_00515 [bacterium]|nr:hypothetical protein [bacterium]
MAKLTITHLSGHKNILASIGSVENVIKGVVPDELKNRRFFASKVKYGFELGSPQDIYTMGECVILNDLIYANRTDDTRTDRDPLMWGHEFVTSGILLIPRDTRPNYAVEYVSLEGGPALRDIYAKIYAKIKKPFAIAGCAELSDLRATAITAPPINRENIFSHKERYYAEREKNEKDQSIAFVGVAAHLGEPGHREIAGKLHRVLYRNPFNKQPDTLTDHTHAVILDRPIITIPGIKPHNVKDMVHLMDDSVVRYVRMEVYVIEDIVEYVEEI